MSSKAKIIDPIDPRVLRAELKEQLLLRKTNRAGNEIYTFHASEAPNLMLEVGRLREEAFRKGGGGTGKAADIDEYDLDPEGYTQLIVWDPERSEILGGYRYILGKDAIGEDGTLKLSSTEIFDFKPIFVQEYLPRTIELGRSFVRLDHQTTGASRKSIFTLDNLWDGLGALMLLYEDYQYFFGKVTIYNSYNVKARDLILYYLDTYHKSKEDMMESLFAVTPETPLVELKSVIRGENAKEDYKAMGKAVRELGTNIPPLVNAYLGLTYSLMYFGVSNNPYFGDVLELSIMVPMEEITIDKKKRHVESFLRDASKTYTSNLLKKMEQRLRKLTSKSADSEERKTQD